MMVGVFGTWMLEDGGSESWATVSDVRSCFIGFAVFTDFEHTCWQTAHISKHSIDRYA